jgi:putative phage-type endonuclease
MKVKTVNGITKYECGTNEEWREERANSIGASAVGAIIGEDYFKTPMQVAVTMREELNGNFNYEENEAMSLGHDLEGGVASHFQRLSGYQIIASSAAETILRDLVHYPFMHASLDRTYWIDNNGPKHGLVSEQNKGVLECKTTRLSIDEDNIPIKWIFQLQVQMGISGYHHGHIAVLSLTTGKFFYKYYDFDPEIFAAAVEVCRDFWERCIIGGEDPEPVSVADYQRLYPMHTIGKTMTVAQSTSDTLAEIKELNDTKKELEAEIDRMKDSIKMQFTDEEAMIDNTGRILATYKTNSKGQRTLLIK